MEYTLTDFTPGQRIQMHPATDLWMRGARFGTVTKVGRKLVTVQLDALSHAIMVAPMNILPLEC